jgi:hypothetical protein
MHEERLSIFGLIEMQIKMKLRFYLTLARMAIILGHLPTNAGKGVWRKEPLSIVGKNAN